MGLRSFLLYSDLFNPLFVAIESYTCS